VRQACGKRRSTLSDETEQGERLFSKDGRAVADRFEPAGSAARCRRAGLNHHGLLPYGVEQARKFRSQVLQLWGAARAA